MALPNEKCDSNLRSRSRSPSFELSHCFETGCDTTGVRWYPAVDEFVGRITSSSAVRRTSRANHCIRFRSFPVRCRLRPDGSSEMGAVLRRSIRSQRCPDRASPDIRVFGGSHAGRLASASMHQSLRVSRRRPPRTLCVIEEKEISTSKHCKVFLLPNMYQ